MAEKGFGVKEVNLIGASGTPTITSPNNLNLNAVNVAISTNVSIGGTLTVSGNVSVGGTLTYEDVTNIDSIGIITARTGLKVLAGGANVVGVVTATSFSGSGANLTNLPAATNVNVTANNDSLVYRVPFASSNTGSAQLYSDGDITYNPNSGTLSATVFSGSGASLTGIAVTEAPAVDYTITGDGSHYYFHGGGVDETAGDPDLYLIRGQKYRFNNTTGSGHPFRFTSTGNKNNGYSNGVTGDEEGVQFWTIPYDAPAKLFYVCTIHSGMVGNIYIRGAGGQNDNVGVTTFSSTVTATEFVPTVAQLAHRNRIHNGGMTIAQRIGDTETTLTDNNWTQTVDRWKCYENTNAVITATRVHGSYPTAGTNPSSHSAHRLKVTTADTSISSSQQSMFAQIIEGFNWQDLRWGTSAAKTVTLSFSVLATGASASNVTGTYCVQCTNPNNYDRAYIREYTIDAINVWKRVTLTFPGDTSGTWSTGTDPACRFAWFLAAGTDHHGSANSWGAFKATTSNQKNFLGYVNNFIFITDVQVEEGTVATPFETKPFSTELQLCQRYYQKLSGAALTYYGVGNIDGANQAQIFVNFITEMRAAPNLQTSGTDGDYFIRVTSNATCTSQPSLSNKTTKNAMVIFTAASHGFTNGHAAFARAANNTNGFLAFSSEY